MVSLTVTLRSHLEVGIKLEGLRAVGRVNVDDSI